MDSSLGLDEFLKPSAVTEIVSSKSFRDGQWKPLTTLKGFPIGVEKRVVPVDLEDFRIFVVTSVAPGTNVSSHSHDEAILRYVIRGSFELEGVEYTEGEWVLVPSGVAYGISTADGYTTLAGYGQACTGS